MSYTAKNFWLDKDETADTMLELLEVCRVFSAKEHKGKIAIYESCDDYFGVEITKEQALALAEEIKQLAESV